jgi:hypothetical protein
MLQIQENASETVLSLIGYILDELRVVADPWYEGSQTMKRITPEKERMIGMRVLTI